MINKYIFKYSILLLLPLFLFSACKTKSVTKDIVELASWEPTTKSLLWKIDKTGFKTSYVFGTIHLINAEDYFLPAGFTKAIDEVDRVVFEIDIANMEDMSSQFGLLTKAFMGNNVSLKDLMSETDYQKVADHFSEMGLPMMFLNRIKPMFLSILGGGDMSPDMLTSGEFVSYEFEINKLVKEKGKATGGLETIEYQMGLFDSIPYKAQADMLLESITTADDGSDMLKELTAFYTAQDLKKMHDQTLSDESGMEKFSEILLYKRNENWIPKMRTLMQDEAAMFAVGAGHLGGTRGVLALLKNAGFEVKPIVL